MFTRSEKNIEICACDWAKGVCRQSQAHALPKNNSFPFAGGQTVSTMQSATVDGRHCDGLEKEEEGCRVTAWSHEDPVVFGHAFNNDSPLMVLQKYVNEDPAAIVAEPPDENRTP